MFAELQKQLFAPRDLASLVVLRIAFGLLLFVEVCRFLILGWVHEIWVEPVKHFTYLGFDWVRPMPSVGMHVLFVGLGILALMIAAGLYHRASSALFCLGFTYVFLLEQSRYLNHFYLICLLSFLLIFLPAHRCCSLDAWRRRKQQWAQETGPAWALWLVRFQLAVVYFYGGLAKLNGDWLLGEPMRIWLAERPDFPLLGPLFTEEWLVYAFTYGGLLLDLLIVPALLYRRTRAVAFAAITLFHVLNSQLFPIGIFPWFMILATTVFFEPEWPRRLLDRWGLIWHDPIRPSTPQPPSDAHARLLVLLLGCYVAVQCLVPLRHHLYPGDASWTEEGHLFAWRMKLRDKRGRLEFLVLDPVTMEEQVHQPLDELPAWQVKVMSFSPDMIVQYAHHLAHRYRQQGQPGVQVRARVAQSLHGRPGQWLIDPETDLARVQRSWQPARWIVPLAHPLPGYAERLAIKRQLAERRERD